ncbi:galactocerebrosidase-like isoform X1 [Haliotis rufescens]|uniref:galactocerebrosidase-like isoform X1 n=1 Tax=Haliotis rufescens TaxID=6454 RepID=UPI00201F3750|nr:galactocerebrosidase-like isoform X1 [Haliotis rufescens]
MGRFSVFSLLYWLCVVKASPVYFIDDSAGLGRRYDGIGGLSGGSATSKLLKAYPEKQRNEVLDYLFKPNFAASLQILKVEIGGDSQSSDATEASHMHNSWEENYQRGYEWWLMGEAKKRNPNIKLYGLPWNFPGWIGNGTQNPYQSPDVLASYIQKWVQGARDAHNLTIDYIGIWNERPYDITYIKLLRQVLDDTGFSHVRIVAADGVWGVEQDILKDKDLAAAVDYIGVHYPGTKSTVDALHTGKQLWSSEDYSSFNNNIGGGCWARILNQNYVNGFMTSTIAWNLIDSYYEGLQWDRDSLMTARQPWSGYYSVESPIWMSGHTTQFTQIGWTYLKHGSGVGLLDSGGSYVSLVSPDGKDLSIVIETMTHDHSKCIRPRLPPYTVEPQTITLDIGGSFGSLQKLNVWYSKLGFNDTDTQSVFFKSLSPVQVTSGKVSLQVGLDEIYTLTTLNTGRKGDYGTPPPYRPFQLPYTEDFESYENHAEPLLMAQQNGAFEVVHIDATVGNVMRQMVLEPPIVWCPTYDKFNATMNLLGAVTWHDVYIDTEVQVSKVNGTGGIYVAARINLTGCYTFSSGGIFFFLFPVNESYIVSNDIGRINIIKEGSQTLSSPYGWNQLSLSVQDRQAVGHVNGDLLFNISVPDVPSQGFAAVGTSDYGIADFDNLQLANSMEEAVQGKSNRKNGDSYSRKSHDDTLYFKPGRH